MKNKLLICYYLFILGVCAISSTCAIPSVPLFQEKKDYGIQEEKRPYTKPNDRHYLPKNLKATPKPSPPKSKLDSISKKATKHP